MTRRDYNQQLCMILSTLVDSYPDLRFSQILQSFGFIKTMPDSNGNINCINEFYEEPGVILERVNTTILTVNLSKATNQDLTIKRLKELLEIKDKLQTITLTALGYMNVKVINGETLIHADERYIEEIHRLLLGGPHFERQK